MTNKDRMLNTLQTGSLNFITTPGGSEVYFDGPTPTLQGTSDPITGILLISSGLTDGQMVNYIVRKVNYSDATGTVTVVAAITTDVPVTLDPLPGSLNISSTPSGAEIFINNVDTGVTTPNTILNLAPGSYDVRLTLANYQDLVIPSIPIGPNEIVTLTETLDPLPGSITISSTPSGAKIFINDVDAGVTTPNTITDLTPDTYNIKLTLANYQDFTATIAIGPNETRTTPTYVLIPLPVSVDIDTVPTGALITIRDNTDTVIYTNTTPISIDVPPGSYTYTISMVGYQDITGPIDVFIGQPIDMTGINAIKLIPLVEINSIPAGALIYIDDSPTSSGSTPSTLALTEGTHTYKLSLAGNYDATGTFTIVAGQPATPILETMVLITGSLNISSIPSGAAIYIDDSPASSGTTPAILTLTEGSHTFRLSLTGYYDNIETVNIVRNQTTTLSVNLLQATGDIYINSSPAGAEIFIDDIDQVITTPNVITHISVGTHTYRLTLGAYLPSTGNFDIIQDQLTRLNVTMVILPGNLSVESIPPGAEIYVNGLDQGVTTPNTITNLAPGSYDIKLTLTSYIDYTTTVTIETNLPTPLIADLIPIPGNLTIDSIPSGAEIFINDIDQGIVTPSTISNLIPGSYNIKLTLANYIDFTTTVTIGPNETVTQIYTLAPMPGSLTIRSTPSGATISVDGLDTGLITPNTVIDVPTGTHTIQLSLENYNDSPDTVVIVDPNQAVTVPDIILVPMPGSLVIDSTPSGAEIFINDEDKGIVTPNTISDLVPGTYNIKLTLANYVDFTTTVTIGPNQTITQTYPLTPMPGNLTIISSPPGAGIWLALQPGTPADTGIITPNPVTGLAPGTYNVKLTLVHYYDLSITSVVISPNQGTTITSDVATLIPLPGFLDITSTPSDAEIFINDVDQNVTTHSTISDLVPGTYNIRLVLANYFDYTTTETLIPEQGKYIDVSLTPMPGSLTINSTPSGASVYVDAQLQIGTTPMTVTNLDPIIHAIKLTRFEYRDFTANVTIGPNQAVTLNATMRLLPGGLIVNSIPSGASIYIDDNLQVGVTPSAFSLDEGSHTLKLSLVGYNDIEQPFDIIHMQTTIISQVLTEATGDVLISSTPSGAKIFIDGLEKIGLTTPVTLTRLLAGTHTYRLTLTGYVDASGEFDITVGQQTTLAVALTPQVVQAGFGVPEMILIGGIGVGMLLMAGKKS